MIQRELRRARRAIWRCQTAHRAQLHITRPQHTKHRHPRNRHAGGLSTAAADTSDKLAAVLCCLPEAAVPQDIGYEHTFIHQVADFLKSLETGEPMHPSFRDALETQKVCDAVLASAKTGSWTNVEA